MRADGTMNEGGAKCSIENYEIIVSPASACILK